MRCCENFTFGHDIFITLMDSFCVIVCVVKFCCMLCRVNRRVILCSSSYEVVCSLPPDFWCLVKCLVTSVIYEYFP